MGKQTLLIVDDDKEFVRNLQESIFEIGDNYEVKTSDDGQRALEILETEKIDLVILDIQVPVLNGLQLLTELNNKGIWLPIIIITDSNINEKDTKLREFGIVDFIKKPFLPEEVVIRIDRIMKNREKKDLIKNFGLPSILQLIEMDKRTGILTLGIDSHTGRVFFRDGKMMDIEIKGIQRDDALKMLIESLYDDQEISIEYIEHRKDKKINMSLMQIVMEASRIKDEKKASTASIEEKPRNTNVSAHESLSAISTTLDSLKEVGNYFITDTQGEVLLASPKNYDEDLVNLNNYLWVVGENLGEELKLGLPSSLISYTKTGKSLAWKCGSLVIFLELTETAKIIPFKEKCCDIFNKSSIEMEHRDRGDIGDRR